MMQKTINRHKILHIVTLIAVIALFALLFGLSKAFTARAEGNNSGSHGTNDYDIALVLDVNGRDAKVVSSIRDAQAEDIERNNGVHVKQRQLSRAAVIAAYNAKHLSDQITNVNSITFVDGSQKVYGDEIEVSYDDTTYNTMFVNAVKATSDVRFSVELSDGHIVYFQVKVEDSFAQRADVDAGGWNYSDSTKNVRIGGKVTDGTTEDSSFKAVRLSNFEKWKFSLKDYLCGRALYCKESQTDSDYKQKIMMAPGSANYWTVNSAENFIVKSVTFGGLDKAFTDVSILNPSSSSNYSAEVSATLSLTTSMVNTYLGDHDMTMKAFWESTHNVEVTIATVENPDIGYIVCIPVQFVAANPKVVSLDSTRLNLNITSEYIYDYANNRYFHKDDPDTPLSTIDRDSGYSAVIIRPADLVDYCHAVNGNTDIVRFVTDGTDMGSLQDDYVLEEYEFIEGTNIPTAYKVTAQSNGQYSINFRISYRTELSENPFMMDILTSINGFGNYEVTFGTLEGKHAVTYNVLTSDVFDLLREQEYQMTSVESNNKKVLEATLSNNVLTLKPNVDNIDGQATASVTMTFTNTSGQTIKITSNEFGIDVKAGSFWARFDDWQGWLIIAACIVGGILLILLVVWLVFRSISKRREEANATAAPVSSYIVKLNSTIAATQAQQRLVATQALSQANSQMLLGAGPTGTQAPPADTLQLATGMPSVPQATDSAPSAPSPAMSTPRETEENYDELIAKYITDEELLERIYIEKYEPKGMVRRTFFKSKDLQARELEKEKKRIVERYKSPMPMDEAIMSEAEIAKAEAGDSPAVSEPKEEEPVFVIDLGFDPEAPLYVQPTDEFKDEKIDIDVAPEEALYNDLERRDELLRRELDELRRRIDKVQSELNRNASLEAELREKIAKAEADDDKFKKDIEELEFKLASAKQKEKDKIMRDISTTETKKERNVKELERLRAELEALLGGGQKLEGVMSSLVATQEQKQGEKDGLTTDLGKAKADLDAYKVRLETVRLRQELEGKLEGLTPMLVTVNSLDHEIRELGVSTEKYEKERDSLKAEVASAKSQILGANDFEIINELNIRISDANARLSEIDREQTKSTKRKSDLNIEFTSQRRKANDYVEKNDIPLEEVIKAEDAVIGDLAMENLRREREYEREESEKAVARAQASLDDVTASASDVTMVAMDIASQLQDLETELATAQSELDVINAQMETASDDEKLMLMVEQGDKSDKVEELNERIKQMNVEGTKRKMEVQADYDARIEEARRVLDEAGEEFKIASAKYDALADTNPLDLIVSGSGIISQDQKKLEAENYKKQLEKSKNEIEQARLAAQNAQMEAEQARLDALKASDEAKAEAERVAQEAIERAEAARLEAEEKARAEAEAAEQARRAAEEAAEQARLEAEEAAEKARLDAEQARKEAEEAAEKARLEAAEAAEQARLDAEQARKEAEEAAEQARRQVEENMIAETEEAKRKAQEEIEEMKRRAEEDAANKQREEEERLKAEAARRDAIAQKVAARKEKIVVIRERMKDIKGDEDAKNLREQLYTMQLSFDEDEHGSTELMDFYNKTMDDIQHAGEIATLKAENAKKPKRVVKKVTERVNRIPKKKAGARGKRPASGARRPVSAGARRPSSAAGARRPSSGARRPSGTRPGTRPPTGRR